LKKPISRARRLIKNIYRNKKQLPAEILSARRRLLNEPFFLMALIAAACLAPLFIIGFTLYGAERQRLYGIHPETVLDQLSGTLVIELIVFSISAASRPV